MRNRGYLSPFAEKPHRYPIATERIVEGDEVRGVSFFGRESKMANRSFGQLLDLLPIDRLAHRKISRALKMPASSAFTSASLL